MGTTVIKRPRVISSRISRPSSRLLRFASHPLWAPASLASHDHISLQFFTQSNPLNNLNITSSIPPILQRQNSAPAQQQQQQHHQSSAQNQSNGDFYKLNKTVAQPMPASHRPTTAGEIHRKFSLPMNTVPSQPLVATSIYNPPMMRKQSAPTIHPIAPSSQQQFQQQPHASPSRARDRNNFGDKVPSTQDVQQLALLKGGLNCSGVHFILSLPLCSIRKAFAPFIFIVLGGEMWRQRGRERRHQEWFLTWMMNWWFPPSSHATFIRLINNLFSFFSQILRSRQHRTRRALYQKDPSVLRPLRFHWTAGRFEMEGS